MPAGKKYQWREVLSKLHYKEKRGGGGGGGGGSGIPVYPKKNSPNYPQIPKIHPTQNYTQVYTLYLKFKESDIPSTRI